MSAAELVAEPGDCAFDGGVFCESCASSGSVGNAVPVDAHMHGCPPLPEEILKGIIKAIPR